MSAAILLVLNIEAAEEGADVLWIAMGQIDPGRLLIRFTFIELKEMASRAVGFVSDRPLVFPLGVALVATPAIQAFRDLTRPQVDRVIEFQRVHIENLVPYQPELG